MITEKEKIYNWLRFALQQSTGRFQELFYFDKRDHEFFSILVVDYFLFDENFDVATDVISSYSSQNVEKIGEKLRRIESGSSEIVGVPRLGTSTSQHGNEYPFSEIDSFLSLNAINIEDATIWLPEEAGRITIDLQSEV